MSDKIIQRMGLKKYVFDFQDEKLDVLQDLFFRRSSFSIAYKDIPNNNINQAEDRSDLIIAPLFAVIFIATFAAIVHQLSNKNPVSLIEGAICALSFFSMMFFYKKSKLANYTIIPTAAGFIKILQGKHHDHLINEIYAHQKQAIRKIYMPIDQNYTKDHQIEKITQLCRNGYISEDEFKEIVLNINRLYSQGAVHEDLATHH